MRFRRPIAREATLLLVVVSLANLGATGQANRVVDTVRDRNSEATRALLKQHADVNLPEPDGTTALHWAIRAGDVATVELLIRAGANVRATNRYGVTPLWLAAADGNGALVERLLGAGADANAALPEGETVLMTAARTNSARAVRALLDYGADPNARETWFGQTALMWAAAANRAEVVRELINYGAEVNARSTLLPNVPVELRDMTLSTFARGSFTPLMFAARQGSREAAGALIEGGADMNAADPEFGITPLLEAITNAHFDVAALLVEKGADLERTDLSGRGPLYAAVDMHSPEHVINRPPPRPSGKLDSLDLIKVLLAHGANPNATLKRSPPKGGGPTQGEGATPLFRAAKTADVTVMQVLLKGGADPHVRLMRDRATVLMVAAGLGWSYGGASYAGRPVSEDDAVDAVRLCLAQGVDINASNTEGITALHAAATKGAESVVHFLATNGARLDAKDKRDRTALDAALGVGVRTGLAQATHESTVALLRQLMTDRAAMRAATP